MNVPAKGSCLIGLGLGIFVALAGRPARAADGPLLVVVEAPPALDADASEIRRAIGAELRSETIAPMKTSAASPGRALIVALDRERIAMSLRAGDATPIARSIPAPPEHAARLRAIAWLAGNLARDQVTPILADAANLPSTPNATEPLGTSASRGPDDTTPSPAHRSMNEPPQFEAPAATVAAHVDPERAQPTAWTIGAATGPAISLYETGHVLRQSIFGSWGANSVGQIFDDIATIWRIDLRHRTNGSRLFTGLALEGSAGDGSQSEIIGAMGLVGSAIRLGGWSLEGSLGVGLDLSERPGPVEIVASGNTTTVFQDSPLRPSQFAAGSLAVSHAIVDSVDLALSLDAHVSTTDEFDGYLATMIGLRYRL
jgi:hypothetical protein